MMTFGSLFAGIGGFDLGLERAGMRCLWQVEINDFCNQVLEKHWPAVKRFRDVRECGTHNLEPVDLVCGGFPCQPYSLAGQRRGAADDRHLWPEMRRVVAELQPRWVLGENVPGIISMELDAVCADLEALDYEVWPVIIPAVAVDAWHRRSRVWIVAYRDGNGRRQWPDKQEQIGGSEREAGFGADVSSGTLADAALRRIRCGDASGQSGQPTLSSQNVPDAALMLRPEIVRVQSDGDVPGNDVHADGEPSGRATESRCEPCEWEPEPGMGRVAHGVPHRVDRLRALGNAVVPQVVEQIGRMIVEVNHAAR